MPSNPDPSIPSIPATSAIPARRRGSLTARLVTMTVIVALASSVLTGLMLARTLALSNREQATATLMTEADQLAAFVEDGRQLRATRLQRVLDARANWVVEVAARGSAPARSPFVMGDITAAVAGSAPVERTVSGTTWLVISRPAGGNVLLVARRLGAAVKLTPLQRRRAWLGAALGLLGGGLAGFMLALSVTRPLGRLASAARRMSAGERDVHVPPEGPAEVADVAEAFCTLSRALAASEERQRRFLLAVSHELRTPLTAVAGYAEALADRALPPAEVPHAAEVIVTETGRLQRRVEDLLALARLEADDFRLAPAPTDVGALVRAAAAACLPRASSSDVRLTVEAPDVGPVVVTDGERLRQAVDALADNALKVLPAGAPLVLACLPLPGGGVRVEVRDGGPGLPPEDLAVAFERGRLTERYRGNRAVGSGVGLALVGELARRMGGVATADPALEGGVRFAVTLPPGPPA